MSALIRLLESAPRYFGLLRSQYWSAERLRSYQEEGLRSTLAAAARIPFYEERLGRIRRLEDFAELPILRREEIDALFRSAQAVRPAKGSVAHAVSSGTSGPRADFLFDRAHQQSRYAARARYLLANGWDPVRRSVWLVGAGLLNPDPDSDYEDRHFVDGRLLVGVRFLSISMELSQLAAAIAKIDPFFIYVYPSVLKGLLTVFDQQDLRLPSLRRVLTGAEILEDAVRNRARQILAVEIAENYGSTEAFIAWQCPSGGLHQNAEHVFVELLDEAGRQAAVGDIGRVVLTTLANRVMPLVRYEIGDYAIAETGRCKCGRTLPLIGRILGRGMNLFRGTDGNLRATWDFANVILNFPDIEQFQLVQTALDRIVVKYVSRGSIGHEIESKIRTEFCTYLGGPVRIDFQRVNDIPRSAGGKFMLTVSELAV